MAIFLMLLLWLPLAVSATQVAWLIIYNVHLEYDSRQKHQYLVGAARSLMAPGTGLWRRPPAD